MIRPTRRRFAAGLAAAPFLGASTALPSNPRVAIIGAGVAGLAASKALTRARVEHVILEAGGRLGGRAFTPSVRGLAFDAGASWLHSADQNPFTAIAAGLGLKTSPDEADLRLYLGGVRKSQSFVAATEDAIARLNEAITTAGSGSVDVAARDEKDVPVTLADRFAEMMLVQSTGAPLTEISAIDFARQIDTGHEHFVEGGLGRLVRRWADAPPVRLHAAVNAIDWSRGAGVRVEGSFGSITVDACLVTVSIGVLQSNAIRVTPRPPQLDAICDGLIMGVLEKVLIPTPQEYLAEWAPNSNATVLAPGGAVGFVVRPDGVNGMMSLAGGRVLPQSEHIEMVANGARDVFGASAINIVKQGTATDWQADPLFRGSFSAAKVGRADLRRQPDPIDNRLFLAGEAFDPAWGSTIVGAKRSGERAAGQILQALKAPSPR